MADSPQINRRDFVKATAGGAVALGLSTLGGPSMASDAAPVDVGTHAQFFLDDLLVDQSEGLAREVNPAQKAGIALGPEMPWEAYRAAPMCVLEDEGIYKMWYATVAHYPGVEGTVACPRCGVANDGNKVVCVRCGWPLIDVDYIRQGLMHACYAVSDDGVYWERPDLGLVEFDGGTSNNIIDGISGSTFVPAVNPLGPPNEKFMAVTELGGKLYVCVSPDGLRWTRKPNPVLPFSADTNNQIIYDPHLGKYVAFLRGFPGRRTTVRCEFESLDEAPWAYRPTDRRPDATGTLYIEDELDTALDIDEHDPPLPGLDINHISASLYAEGVYLGFPGVFRKYPPAGLVREGREEHRYFAQGNDGTFETQLALSRDGRHWSRPDRSPYVSTGLHGSPDGGLVMVAPGMLVRGETIYQYYAGQRVTHGIFSPGEDERVGGIFRLEQDRDRFIALSCGPSGGTFRTPGLRHTGTKLELNVDCSGLGEASVQVLDAAGGPVPGLGREDCDRVDLNQLRHTVTWKGRSDLSALAGKPILLEFFMRSAKLYTFRFAPA